MLSVSGNTAALGAGANADASMGVTVTLTPPPGYAGGPVSVGFGSTYQIMLSQVPDCVEGICPKKLRCCGNRIRGPVQVKWSVEKSSLRH